LSPPAPSPPSLLPTRSGEAWGWLCASSCVLRCSPGLAMACKEAAYRPWRLIPGPSRLARPLLFLLSFGPPRPNLLVVTLSLAVPVVRSVRQLLCAPFIYNPYFHTGPPRHSSLTRETPSSLRFVFTPCRVTCVSATRAARRPLASRPGWPGVGVRVLMRGGLLVLLLVGGELHLPLLVRGMLTVMVGARLLLLHVMDIGLPLLGARRRRSGGGPGGGCARKPVGIPSPPRGGPWKPRSRAKLGTVGG
jgi:hypothetical protein